MAALGLRTSVSDASTSRFGTRMQHAGEVGIDVIEIERAQRD
jgi:hypothetical protein